MFDNEDDEENEEELVLYEEEDTDTEDIDLAGAFVGSISIKPSQARWYIPPRSLQ